MKKEVLGVASTKEKTISELAKRNGCFYIYLYRKECPYCKNISYDMEKFKKENRVYTINVDSVDDFKEYNWVKHEKKYDVEIGERKKDGELIYYDGLDMKEIEKKYPPLEFKIVLADSDYIMLHPNKKMNKIYAVSTHPQLNKEELRTDSFLLPGVPILLKINNHKIVNYFFDDKEIIHFLKSDTIPKDVYWNIKM